ncbi:MAG: ORF6N domain-containing protein [Candidatus Saccharibacteria bacterium]|nr:ORF6N domain-containing protein [Candidatus Saccharibacteria bacterium]
MELEKMNSRPEQMIYEIRGKQVMLDSDLAKLYECKNGTKAINLAVKRNINRFPERFMFQLTDEEMYHLRFQNETANMTRVNHYVFTEEGVAMLATVIHTAVAETVSVRIMDAFVAMRKYIGGNLLEQKYINNQVMKNTEAKEKLIIDEKKVYHCGASVNKIGTKTFSITEISDEFMVRRLLKKLAA